MYGERLAAATTTDMALAAITGVMPPAATLALRADTPTAATSPDGQRCFRATTGPIGKLRCVDQIADAVLAGDRGMHSQGVCCS
jgi:hypothetical protein